jgi:excisionase family DNA binding protein
MDEWLSTREAADILRVSEATVRRWSDDGSLPGRRVGKRRQRRFRARDVEAFSEPRASPAQPRRDPIVSASVGGIAVEAYSHLAAFYNTDAGMLRLTVPFLADGLRAGQPCFLMASGAVQETYLRALRRMLGHDLDAGLGGGGLVYRDGPGGSVEAALEFWEQALWSGIEKGAPLIRGVGEMHCVREQFSSEADMMTFEAAQNSTAKRFPCVLICQYDARRFSGETMLEALRTHPDLFSLPLGRFLN